MGSVPKQAPPKQSHSSAGAATATQAAGPKRVPARWLPEKCALAITCFLFLTALPESVPALRNYRIFDWSALGSVLVFKEKPKSAAPIEKEVARLRPERALSQPAPVQLLIDPANNLLPFYRALHETEKKAAGAVTRIVHYGDSPTTADLITADLRSTFQEQFGDAGHGFVLIGKPWAWYGHRGVDIQSSGWQISPATTSGDGLYGFGGVSFTGSPGATATIALKGQSSAEIAYQQQPSGGKFELIAGDQKVAEVDSQAEVAQAAFKWFDLPAGATELTIRVTSGSPRVFGVQFLSNKHGVIYDSLGLNGAYTSVLSRMFRQDHWAQQLRHYRPSLIVINYGTNESVYAKYVDFSYVHELREVIRRIRAAVPGTPILVMSPMDRGQRDASGQIGTVPELTRLVMLQQKVAAETGCAFYNTFQAMGGAGTMGKWYEAEPRLVSADFIHPMPSGARLVGNLLYKSLLDGYRSYRLKRVAEKIASTAPRELEQAR